MRGQCEKDSGVKQYAHDEMKASRETAQAILRQRIAALRGKANELEALLETVGEAGSPAEAALWALLVSQRHHDIG